MNVNYVEPLSENSVKKLLSSDMTMKEAKSLTVQIESRFDYVVKKICELTEKELNWFDYSNEAGDGETLGFFDPDRCQSNIAIHIAYYKEAWHKKELFDKYSEFIPVSFLWTPFENRVSIEYQTFKNEVDAKVANSKRIEEERSQRLNAIIESVKSKVTPEEFACLSFQLPSNKKHQKGH